MKKYISDIMSGLSLVLINATVVLPFGLLAFPMLAPEQSYIALLAGVLATAVSSFLLAFLPYSYKVSAGPNPIFAVLTGQLLVGFLAVGTYSQPTPFSYLFFIYFLMVILAAFFQFILTILNFHALFKYISFPVSVGLITSLGIIISKLSLEMILGIKFSQLLSSYSQINWVHILLGFVCFCIFKFDIKFKLPFQAILISLLVGTCLHYIAFLMGYVEYASHHFDQNLFVPLQDLSVSMQLFFEGNWSDKVIKLIFSSLVLTVMSFLNNLVSFASIKEIINEKIDPKKYLVLDSISNPIIVLFGGIISPITIGGTTLLKHLKVQSKTLVLTCGICSFGIFLFFPQLCLYIPYAALGAVLLVISLSFFHKWFLKSTIEILFENKYKDKKLFLNWLISVIVIATVFLSDFMIALGVGIVVSIIIFLFNINQNLIKKVQHADQISSPIIRSFEQKEILKKFGHQILIVDLQGPLFFGSCDTLIERLEQTDSLNESYIILNFTKISDLDLTAQDLLKTAIINASEKGKIVMLSGLSERFNELITDYKKNTDIKIFKSVHKAVYYAEDLLLSNHTFQESFSSLNSILTGFGLNEQEVIQCDSVFQKKTVKKGGVVLEEGDANASLFILLAGKLEIRRQVDETEKHVYLATILPGSLFGEMSFVDQSLASAQVIALEDSKVYELDSKSFEQIKADCPNLALKIQAIIFKVLSKKLRLTSRLYINTH